MVYNFSWMRSHLNTSFTQFRQRQKKKISLQFTLRPVAAGKHSAVSSPADHLPQNQGGAAVEKGRWLLQTHLSELPRNPAPSASEDGEKGGSEAGEPVADLVAPETTDTAKPANLLYTCLYFCCLCFPSCYPREEKGNEIIFCIGYKPSGKYTIFPSSTSLHGLSFPHFNCMHVFSPGNMVGRVLLLLKLLVLL